MSLNLLFWVLYIVGVLLFGVGQWPITNRFGFGSGLLMVVLVGLLGWATFGAAVHR